MFHNKGNSTTRKGGLIMKQFRMDTTKGLEIGIFSLGDHIPNPHTKEYISQQQRINEFIEMAKLADEAGLDVFGLGESHQEYFTGQAHTVILGAIAQATKNIKIASAASIVSTWEPVRLYEDFATLDLISNGRAELVGGRASRIGLFELLGFDVRDYEELFEEKFELLTKINEEERITWQGKFRAPLRNAKVIPDPLEGKLPIWRAVGGHAASAIKAGYAGVPMVMATLGGPSVHFKNTIDAYREALTVSGFDPKDLPVATTGLFYAAETTQQAMREMYPHLDKGFEAINRNGYPKSLFAESSDTRQSMLVGSPQQIIEKILYQHELYGHQRFMAQIDFGGVPFDKIMKNIEFIGNEILPAVKKYTSK